MSYFVTYIQNTHSWIYYVSIYSISIAHGLKYHNFFKLKILHHFNREWQFLKISWIGFTKLSRKGFCLMMSFPRTHPHLIFLLLWFICIILCNIETGNIISVITASFIKFMSEELNNIKRYICTICIGFMQMANHGK